MLDACLILHAEHTMNASTFTARVTGSTLANPYQTIASAIGTLSGPLHGGANEEVLRQFEEIGGPENVKAWLDAKLAADPKYKVMGFGHRVYKVKDPRATVLQELAEHVFAETSRPKNYEIGARTGDASAPASTGRRASTRTSISTPASSTRRSASRRDVFTPIFAIARVAGWLAHWLEQLDGNRIFRPEQIFVGKTDVEYVPLESGRDEPVPSRGRIVDDRHVPLAKPSTRSTSPAGTRCERIDTVPLGRLVHDPAGRRVARRLAGRAPRDRRVPALPRAARGRAPPADEALDARRVPEAVRPRLDARRRSPAYSPPSEIRAVFDRVHARVMAELPAYPDADLDLPPLMPHPLFTTRIAGLRYAPLHEMIHCGQIALIRRMFGQKPIW